jgi:hypothetical protein
MPTIRQGGCLCGAVRYQITAEPTFAGHCQCRDCQRETGAGHASFMVFPAEAVQLSGTLRHYESTADSGNRIRRGFCPTCSSSITSHSSGLPQMIAIPAGSLDDPSVFKPGFVVYTSRGHAWDRIDPALPSFAEMPPVPDEPLRAAGG